jgi:hypothetical protein
MRGRGALLYGVPSFERANASALNHLALFAQAEIQPFKIEKGRKFNECHYYVLPIPRRMLEELENEIVEMKVTLSYFIDPNPGLSANVDAQRYQSHGLRFDHQRKNESATRQNGKIPVGGPPMSLRTCGGCSARTASQQARCIAMSGPARQSSC